MHTKLSADTLRRAASIKEEIERLETQYGAIIEGTVPRRGRKPEPQPTRRKKRKISPEARARMVAAAKARWAREKKARK